MSIYEINQLNVKEKIILMNDIWESLEIESDLIESPRWHKEVLEERIAKIKNNKVKYISLEELDKEKIIDIDIWSKFRGIRNSNHMIILPSKMKNWKLSII